VALAALAAVLLLMRVDAAAAPEKAAGGIRFTYRDPNAGTVAWAGAFNNWSTSANPMKKEEAGLWSVVIALPPGEQQYKLVVDGQWFADPENGVTAGEFGNSVVKVAADGGLVAQAATSNTAYSPKITISGRDHTLFEELYDSPLSRYELSRPLFDIDLGFGVRVSDVLRANVLTNINPQKEDVQDYRSRLNWKRGSIEFEQPELRIVAFDSEPLADWDDPARLVGRIGIYDHPFGYQQDGFQLTSPKLGFETKVLYSDNSAPGGTEFPGGSNFYDFTVDRGTNRKLVFEGDAVSKSWQQLRTVRTASGMFVLVPGQLSKLTTTDVGDGGHTFGFGDGATNVFAASVRRSWKGSMGTLRLGVLGRSNRGFNLGRLVLATPSSDSTGTITYGQTEQESFAGGGELRWDASRGVSFYAEYLQGARRLDMMDRATRLGFTAQGMTGTGPASVALDTLPSPLGQHYNLDESGRWIAGGSWTFAQGDVRFSTEVERQTHRYPAWSQPPLAPAGLANNDHVQFENVDFQRAVYQAASDLDNKMLEWRLRWDRNWRYYLGREVKTSLGLDLTHFTYDSRTAWEDQIWFPSGNLWLDQQGQVVRIDRMTLLGEVRAFTLRPSLEVPIRRARNVTFAWHGDWAGTKVGLRPRYAENIFQLGSDVTRLLRFTDDTRWVKYDAPSLQLSRAYVSTFAELVYRFADGIHVGLGWGVDPTILDPVTNEFEPIGRETYLSDRNVNGYVAQSNWLSLAPQIAAAEKALQLARRVQFEAVVHF
jgi:hypothetical protein